MDIIKSIEEKQKRASAQGFGVGDTVKVYFKIVEGKTERIQVYEGTVICKHGGGTRETFTVRKDSYGVGVERVFPMHSPRIAKVDIVRPGKVRRAKLYYLRNAVGKAAKVKARVGGNIAKKIAERNARANAAMQETMAKEAAAKQASQEAAK
ncbi:MAG: 50S ribosomal protein L19 [Treponema sp.]|nr:50S ribosomal protein L19 [Treponema sp.]